METCQIKGKRNGISWAKTVLAAATFAAFALPALAEPVRNDEAQIAGKTFPYVYEWKEPDYAPRAVVIAIHGLTLHGSIYDTVAKHLAARGFAVYAPDLRGYGRWLALSHKGKASSQNVGRTGTTKNADKISYPLSRADLLELVHAAKAEYPDVPMFLLGESLGASMALYAASEAPGCVDGIVLSAPAIKRKVHLYTDCTELIASGFTQLGIKPYLRHFASDDPRIAQEALDDPLIRKQISTADLVRSLKVLGETIKFAQKVPANIPILLLQGGHDQLIQIEEVSKLLSHLNSNDQTVKWFTDRGHLLLETSFVKQETFAALDIWLDGHTASELPGQVSVSYEMR